MAPNVGMELNLVRNDDVVITQGPGRRVEVEVGDRIDDDSTMDQPKEVEVGRRSSSSLSLSGI